MLSMFRNESGKTVLEMKDCETIKNVKILKMKNLGLTAFDQQMFCQMTDIEDLDISGNDIDSIPDFLKLPNLRTLNCAGNKINDLSFVQHYPKLEEIDMTNNEVAFSDFCVASLLCPTLKKINGQSLDFCKLNEKLEAKLLPVIRKVWHDRFIDRDITNMSEIEFHALSERFRLLVTQTKISGTKLIEKFKNVKLRLMIDSFLSQIRRDDSAGKNSVSSAKSSGISKRIVRMNSVGTQESASSSIGSHDGAEGIEFAILDDEDLPDFIIESESSDSMASQVQNTESLLLLATACHQPQQIADEAAESFEVILVSENGSPLNGDGLLQEIILQGSDQLTFVDEQGVLVKDADGNFCIQEAQCARIFTYEPQDIVATLTPESNPETIQAKQAEPVQDPVPGEKAVTGVPEPTVPSDKAVTGIPEPTVPSDKAVTGVPEPMVPSEKAVTGVPEPPKLIHLPKRPVAGRHVPKAAERTEGSLVSAGGGASRANSTQNADRSFSVITSAQEKPQTENVGPRKVVKFWMYDEKIAPKKAAPKPAKVANKKGNLSRFIVGPASIHSIANRRNTTANNVNADVSPQPEKAAEVPTPRCEEVQEVVLVDQSSPTPAVEIVADDAELGKGRPPRKKVRFLDEVEQNHGNDAVGGETHDQSTTSS